MIGFRDIETDNDGDIVIDATGDLKLASAPRTVIQDAMFRLRTGHFDYEIMPRIGANITSLIGESNNAPNGQKIIDMVNRSFTHDGRFMMTDFKAKVAPISRNAIALILKFKPILGIDEPINMLVSLNYHTGTIELVPPRS